MIPGPVDDSSCSVDLVFAARNLKDQDTFSKSDPFLILSIQAGAAAKPTLLGRTETVSDNTNPNWQTKMSVRYFFEMKQRIFIQVFDEDSKDSADLIGKGETTLGAIMGSSNQNLILDIKGQGGGPAGKVIIRADVSQQSAKSIMMSWRGGKITNVDSFFDFWDKSDPYLKFMKMRTDKTFIQAQRTQVVFDSLQPKWKPISIPFKKLVGNEDPNAYFKIECWDFEEEGKEHQFIGEITATIDAVLNQKFKEYPLQNPKIQKPGILILEDVKQVITPLFTDYLRSGLNLNLVVAIDFTGSNGVPKSPNSLHYVSNQMNMYQRVLFQVHQIIENYDSDKLIPAFGFGAKPRFPRLTEPAVSHCFPLTGDPAIVQVMGFENLMSAYVNAVMHVEFGGPTYFAPLLKAAFIEASKLTGSFGYQILLILTDGEIHDMDATKDLIVQNSCLPTSIIIVGIGNADFANMEALDGDNGLFSTTGVKCTRDMVQFVPFNQFGNDATLLCLELLREIPTQVVSYMVMNGILPKPVP